MNNQRCTGVDSPVTHLIIKRGVMIIQQAPRPIIKQQIIGAWVGIVDTPTDYSAKRSVIIKQGYLD